MSGLQKRVVADARFLIKAFEEKPSDYKLAWEKLQAEVEQNIRLQATKKAATIAPSSLLLHEAMEIFGFTDGNELILTGEANPVPQYLIDSIARIKHVTGVNSLYNEAYTRTILDQIIIGCVYEENIASQRGRSESPPGEPPAVCHSHPPKPQLIIEEPAQLELSHETPLSGEIVFKGEDRILTGFADYSLFYESKSKDTLGTNLVIMEAKKTGFSDGALPQLVSYLGIVPTARREQGKSNAVVYGIASNGVVFRFCRVNNDGQFSQSAPLDWRMDGHKERIFSTIRMIVRTAALSSPSTTPIKDPAHRKMILGAFGSPSTKVDFGIELFEVGEEEEGDYIIIGGDTRGRGGAGTGDGNGGEGEKGGKGGKRSQENDVSREYSGTAPKRQKGDGC
ncbi:hypothetical protein V501_01711 [Pseudogymnoascus sp. VKM F-4519 (FW-2642)]|nr:hypothetical protein V501_01711 [Pseudogymnoascus sp. VKM F-4519 (FW-2642)]